MGMKYSRLGAGLDRKTWKNRRLRTGSDRGMSRRAALAGLGAMALSAPFVNRAQAATTIRMWSFLDPVKGRSSREVVLKKLVDGFEAANPEVKIVVEPQNWQAMSEKFFAAHQTGSAPDISTIVVSRVRGAIKLGALANLDDLFVGKWSQEEKDDIDGPIWRLGAKPNAHYQVPTTSTLYGIIYRADLFKEAGIDPAKVTTWDSFIAAALKLVSKDSSGTVERWGFGQPNTGLTPMSPILLNVLLDEQGTIFDKDMRAKWSTPAGVKGLQLQVDMIRKYKIMPENQINVTAEEVYEQFLAGRAAIVRASTARWLQMAGRFGPGSVGYLPTPSFSGEKPSLSEFQGWHVGVWSGSMNKELAGKFVEHIANREADTLWTTQAGQLPNRQSTITSNAAFFADPKNAILLKAAGDLRTNSWLAPDGAGEGGWNEGFNSAFQDVMINNADPKAALQKAEANFNRMRRR